MNGLAARRYRVTLMAEEKSQGAGGRLVTTSPILADVWAAVEESSGSLIERGAHEFLPTRARFTVQYRPGYQSARRIEWRGGLYRISGMQANRSAAAPSLMFEAALMEGDQP